MNKLARSAALHHRVREFASRSIARPGEGEFPPGKSERAEFDALACEVCSFQTGVEVTSLEEVIHRAVPSDCFRLGSVFAFESSAAELRFVTSGTTGQQTGTHYMRERATYEIVSLGWGGRALDVTEDSVRPLILALAPWTGLTTTSSLGYMMQRLMERFDGRSMSEERSESGFTLDAEERWLVKEGRIDLDGLRRMTELAWRVGTRMAVLATSFALVELLDAADGEIFELPPGSVVMPTGGFKGRTRTIAPEVMFDELRRTFGDIDIVGEYGMTELSSQLYEGTARNGVLAGPSGIYIPPPWLRVYPLDPSTLEPVADGEVGLACFVDLANVDSAVCVLTQDRVRLEGLGIRLLGRQPKAPLRGCSLAVEALLHPRAKRANDDPSPDEPPLVEEARSSLTMPEESRAVLVRQAKIRIAALVSAAKQLRTRLLTSASDEPELTALVASSGSSVEGVRLALERCLETEVSDEDISRLISLVHRNFGATEGTTWVLLSSNVFTAPLRALALAAAVGSRVQVRTSRREPVFTRLLHQRASEQFGIVDELQPQPGDVVLAFGSDEVLAQVAADVPAGVRFVGHGHGMGIAIIGAGAELRRSAAQLALDVVLLDQQGCLSPRLVLVDQRNDVAHFVRLLTQELAKRETSIPLGLSSSLHQHERAWSKRVAEVLGQVTEAGSGWVAEFDADWVRQNQVPIPPPCRSLSLIAVQEPTEYLSALSSLVTNVGVTGDDELRRVIREQLPRARVVELGTMQSPPLDGPVDLRGLTYSP